MARVKRQENLTRCGDHGFRKVSEWKSIGGFAYSGALTLLETVAGCYSGDVRMQGHNAAVRVAMDTGLAAWPGSVDGVVDPAERGVPALWNRCVVGARTSALDPEGFGCGGLSRS